MYRIDQQAFNKALKERGYRSFGALASSAGIHRNTLHYYLSSSSIIPEKLCRVLDLLRLSLGDAFERAANTKELVPADVAGLVDSLHEKYPKVSFFLFGSRARAKAKKYSDFDIGAFSEDGLKTKDYISMCTYKDELEEDLAFYIDLVNLNNANDAFLRQIKPDLEFLAGRRTDVNAINERLMKL